MSFPRDANTTATPCDEGDSIFKITNGLEIVILSNDFEKAAEREFEEGFEYVDMDVASANTTTSPKPAGDLSNAEDFVVIRKEDSYQKDDDQLVSKKLTIAEEVRKLSCDALVKYCALKLNTDRRRRLTVPGPVTTLLVIGLRILDAVNRMWSTEATANTVTDTAASPYWKFTNIQATIYALSNEEQLFFYRTLDCMNALEDKKTIWALQLGLRGLATGWKLDMESPEMFRIAEEQYLIGADIEEKKAIERFATGLEIWGKEVLKRVEVKRKLAAEGMKLRTRLSR